jgi:hypothetical protein
LTWSAPTKFEELDDPDTDAVAHVVDMLEMARSDASVPVQ